MTRLGVLVALAAALVAVGAAARVDNTLVEQYVSVLVAREMVPPEAGDAFFGLLYMTITEAPARRLSWVLWHNIDFAVKATVRSADNETVTGPLLFDLAPGGGSAASSFNCPHTGDIPISETLVDIFHAGMAYAEISSNGRPLGQLRGHIRPRDNAYVALPGAVFNISNPDGNLTMGNTTGMAVVQLFDAGQPVSNPLASLAMDYWFIMRRGGGDVFVGTDRDTGVIRTTFGEPTLFLPNMVSRFNTSEFVSTKAGIIASHIFVPTPLFGPGSSALSFEGQTSGLNLRLADFFRIPNPVRAEFGFGASGVDPDTPGSPAPTPAPSLALLFFLLSLIAFSTS